MIRIISALMCLSIAIVFTAYVCCRDRRAIEQWRDDFFKNLIGFFIALVKDILTEMQ